VMRQAFETPEGDDASRAAMLADELLVTEHVASAPEQWRGRRPPALRTDERKMSDAPALREMSEPVHVVLMRGRRSVSSGLTRS
jgi:hypothetical protein